MSTVTGSIVDWQVASDVHHVLKRSNDGKDPEVISVASPLENHFVVTWRCDEYVYLSVFNRQSDNNVMVLRTTTLVGREKRR